MIAQPDMDRALRGPDAMKGALAQAHDLAVSSRRLLKRGRRQLHDLREFARKHPAHGDNRRTISGLHVAALALLVMLGAGCASTDSATSVSYTGPDGTTFHVVFPK